MKYIGAHVSAEGGVDNTPLRAHEIGAKAFALFTANSNRWSPKPLTEAQCKAFKENCKKYGYAPEFILPHDNFLINLGSGEEELLEKSRKSFLEELKRCEALGLTMLNFHPGSHKKLISEEQCLDTIAASINWAHGLTKNVKTVLECVAGQGSNLGHSFQQLAYIIQKVEDKERVGVCIDTCHAYSAGYDLATEEGYRKTWEEFDEVIGREYLCAVHLNDDKRELGSRVDRHEEIGKGTLGKEFFARLVNDSRFDNMPIILETPNDLIWAEEIQWLYSLVTQTT